MYKLLIVDDEALVREAIRYQMDWAEHGFVCAGDCGDGIEALEFVARETPDVVLADIGMPFMDGLELTRELADKYPAIKVIILTGYDDFDYARQAIKLQAVDYILKPVTAEELGVVLRKLRDELDLAKRQQQDYEQLNRKLTESWPLLKERFLERMMTSRMSERQLQEGWEYFRIEWKGPVLIELVLDIDKFVLSEPATASGQQLIRFAVFNVAQEMLSRYAGSAIFRDREDGILALLSGSDPEALEEEALQVAEEIHRTVTTILPVELSVGIGQPAELGNKVQLAHQSALSALDYRFAAGSNTIIRLTDMIQRNRPEALAIVAWESELVTKLKTEKQEELEAWVDRLFAAFRANMFPAALCQVYLQRIVLALMHMLYDASGDVSRLAAGPHSPLFEITQLASLDEAQAWLKDLCRQTVATIRSKREDHSELQVARAIAYVTANYRDPTLSFKSVCKHISMSMSYFSVLFKLHTGKTFVEYVTHERMEKAKELLACTAMKSYEIAYEVGYSDPHYFSGAFKRHTGETPTDYRFQMTKKA